MPRLALFRLPARIRRRVRRRRVATLAALAALALAVVAPLCAAYCLYRPPRLLVAYLRAAYPDVLFEVATAAPVVALSLDDAPSPHTPELLDVLREHGAHATLFVIGAQVAGRERVLERAVREGHELANHAMRDEPSRALADDELARQLAAVEARLAAAYAAAGARLPNNYFRPGSGLFSRRMRLLLARRGFRLVLGSVYPHDAQLPFAGVNARHILSMVHPGAIIICHDRRPWTAPMLRTVLPELRRRGYRVVTITELVKTAEPLGGR